MDSSLLLIAGPLIAALGAYLVAVRRFSGKIGSSEAEQLWAESKDIREWSGRRIKELEERIAAFESGSEAMRAENRKLTAEVHELRDTIEELRGEIKILTSELKQSRERVTELEDEAK